MSTQCKYVKTDGELCSAHKINGSNFCFVHSSPGNAVIAGKASAKSRSYKGFALNLTGVETIGDVKRLRSRLILEGSKGRVPSSLINALSYSLNGLRTDLQEADISDRLAKLEQRIDEGS